MRNFLSVYGAPLVCLIMIALTVFVTWRTIYLYNLSESTPVVVLPKDVKQTMTIDDLHEPVVHQVVLSPEEMEADLARAKRELEALRRHRLRMQQDTVPEAD